MGSGLKPTVEGRDNMMNRTIQVGKKKVSYQILILIYKFKC